MEEEIERPICNYSETYMDAYDAYDTRYGNTLNMIPRSFVPQNP